MLEGFKFRENTVPQYLGFLSSQVLTLFSFSNIGVLERNDPKESFSQKCIAPLIILGSRL